VVGKPYTDLTAKDFEEHDQGELRRKVLPANATISKVSNGKLNLVQRLAKCWFVHPLVFLKLIAEISYSKVHAVLPKPSLWLSASMPRHHIIKKDAALRYFPKSMTLPANATTSHCRVPAVSQLAYTELGPIQSRRYALYESRREPKR
jgi:hypothetical protein